MKTYYTKKEIVRDFLIKNSKNIKVHPRIDPVEDIIGLAFNELSGELFYIPTGEWIDRKHLNDPNLNVESLNFEDFFNLISNNNNNKKGLLPENIEIGKTYKNVQ